MPLMSGRWRGQTQLSESSPNLVRGPGHSLEIKSLGIGDLGPYTCQAYNGEGRGAVSSTKAHTQFEFGIFGKRGG